MAEFDFPWHLYYFIEGSGDNNRLCDVMFQTTKFKLQIAVINYVLICSFKEAVLHLFLFLFIYIQLGWLTNKGYCGKS